MSNVNINPDALLAQMRAMVEAAQAKPAATNQAAIENKDNFSALLKQSIESVNSTQEKAGKLADAFQNGDPSVQMAEVMVALQKSNVSFQAMLQIRNKLVAAYQEVMNMQI